MQSLATDRALQEKLGIAAKPAVRGGDKPNVQQSPERSALASWLEGETGRCQSYMLPFHRQWYINISAALGAQGVQAETIARLLRVKVKQYPHRVRHQTNIIGGSCRRLIGYLARSNPDIEIVPSDLDNPMQLDLAKAADRYVNWHRDYEQFKRKELEAIEWAVYTGTGILKAGWDTNGGPIMEAIDKEGNPLPDPETGMPMLDRKGRPVRFTTGIASTSVIPTFNFCYGIEARNIDELSWCGEDGWYSFGFIESMWGGVKEKYQLSSEPQYERNRGYYYRQISQSIGPSGTSSGLQPDSSVEGCRITQAYVSPYVLPANEYGKQIHEEGCFAVIAQGHIIHLEENPFLKLRGANPRTDWHPYTILPCYTYPGRFMGQGIPENLIPLQEAINFINSRVREAQRTMGQPKWLVPEGANLKEDKLTGEAGERLKYNPAWGPPTAFTPPPMPGYIFNMLERYYQDVELVASQPPMSQGRAQGQIRSGLGVQLLQEQALTEFTPILKYFEVARARHTRNLLLREIENSEFPRQIQWRGPQGWEQESFFGKRLSPDFTVSVLPGTSMPRSKAVVMSEVERMIAWGVLQPQANPAHNEIIAKAMEYSVPPTMPDNEGENISSARYAMARMMVGEEPPVLAVDNHRVHVNELVRFMQTRKFKEKAEADPTLFQRFMYRLGRHRFFILMKQTGQDVPQPIPPFEDMNQTFPEGQQQIQQVMGGGGGEGGGGGGGGGPPTGAGGPNPMNAGVPGPGAPGSMGNILKMSGQGADNSG